MSLDSLTTDHPLESDRVGYAIANLGQAINELDLALAVDAQLDDRARWLKVLEHSGDGLYQQLAMVVANLKSLMAKQMPFGEDVEVQGAGLLTYSRRSGSKVWKWSALLPVLAAQIADEVFDQETGEIPPLAIVCERAMTRLGDVIGLTPSKQGRTGELEKRHIDVKKYVVTEGGEPSVRFK